MNTNLGTWCLAPCTTTTCVLPLCGIILISEVSVGDPAVSVEELKTKVDMEEEEEKEQPQHSTQSLQRHKKEGEEEDRDLSHGPDTSSLSEDVSDHRPLPSSRWDLFTLLVVYVFSSK